MYPVFSRTWTCSCSSPCLWLWCTLVLLWPTTPPSASTQWRFQPSSSSCAKSHLSQKKQKQTRLLGPKTESNPVPSWSNQESGPGFSFFFFLSGTTDTLAGRSSVPCNGTDRTAGGRRRLLTADAILQLFPNGDERQRAFRCNRKLVCVSAIKTEIFVTFDIPSRTKPLNVNRRNGGGGLGWVPHQSAIYAAFYVLFCCFINQCNFVFLIFWQTWMQHRECGVLPGELSCKSFNLFHSMKTSTSVLRWS